jgi:hypothetical protein
VAAKDNRDSWGMCTTSVECTAILIVLVTVMSSMDPHSIRENWVGMVVLVRSLVGLIV